MTSTMKAAVHLGPNYTKHVEMYKKAKFEEIQNLFDIIQKLIWDHHGEILNVKHIGSTGPSWTRSTLSHDQVIKWAKAKVLVYLDSVLLLGKCQDPSEANRRWEGQVAGNSIEYFLRRITGH